MTEREKLIELLKSPHKAEQLREMGVDIGAYHDDCIEAMIADFLLANGVIVPPCKVGDTVYMPWEWNEIKGVACLTVTEIIFSNSKQYVETDFRTDDEDYSEEYNCGIFTFENFGKTVFLSREEAERIGK